MQESWRDRDCNGAEVDKWTDKRITQRVLDFSNSEIYKAII